MKERVCQINNYITMFSTLKKGQMLCHSTVSLHKVLCTAIDFLFQKQAKGIPTFYDMQIYKDKVIISEF